MFTYVCLGTNDLDLTTYVRDPDGNKLAVVCRGFTDRAGQY
jgi:hypothetical protein